MKKRNLRLISLLLILSAVLCACSPIVTDAPEKISIYASFYPIFALADMIVEDIPDLELHCLVQPQDGCLRSYSLSDWDLYLLAYSADAILMGGCGLESFASTLGSSDLAQAEVLYGLELYEGTGAAEDEGSHFSGENPHIYMSVSGAIRILENITAAMTMFDHRYKEQYEANCQDAAERLNALKAEIEQTTRDLSGKKVIVMNESLIYPALEYDMDIETVYERENGTGIFDDELKSCIEELSACESRLVFIEKHAPELLTAALKDAGFEVAELDVLSTGRESDGYEGYQKAMLANAAEAAAAFRGLNNGG